MTVHTIIVTTIAHVVEAVTGAAPGPTTAPDPALFITANNTTFSSSYIPFIVCHTQVFLIAYIYTVPFLALGNTFLPL